MNLEFVFGFERQKVGKLGFARRKAEQWELIWFEWGAEVTGLVWVLLGTLAQFVKVEFEVFEVGKPEFEKLELKRQEVERRELICLESGTREAVKAEFEYLQLGTLARFAELKFEVFEFGIPGVEMRQFGRQEAEMCELICLESKTREAEMLGLAWLMPGVLGTLATSVEFEAFEFERLGAGKWELICLECVTRRGGKFGFALLL